MKMELFENTDIKTVKLAWAQVMCTFFNVYLSISGKAAFLISVDGETV